jgi:hypothetical protein
MGKALGVGRGPTCWAQTTDHHLCSRGSVEIKGFLLEKGQSGKTELPEPKERPQRKRDKVRMVLSAPPDYQQEAKEIPLLRRGDSLHIYTTYCTHQDGMSFKPKQIAELICMKKLLPKDTIIACQVSDWIAYHKKNKTIKTPPVTGPDMQAEWNDNCKYSSEFFLEFRAKH